MLMDQFNYMDETDMATVVSGSQNEVDDLRKKGVDILPHRKRMVEEELDVQFKDKDNPLRIVFVCAMWMTGFDVPSCSTIYLDKPMKNHTLMQTIARVNRVFKDKHNGLIVDYVGIFRNWKRLYQYTRIQVPIRAIFQSKIRTNFGSFKNSNRRNRDLCDGKRRGFGENKRHTKCTGKNKI